MAHVGPYTSFMSHHIPYFDVAIVTCTQKKMTSFRKESYALNTTLMTNPSINPFLWNKAIMFLISKVRRRIDKTFSCVLQLITISMVYSCCSRLKWEWFGLFLILNFLLSFIFIALHESLLILTQFSLLGLKFFHSFICCPRSLKFACGSISKFLPFHLQQSALGLSRQVAWLLLLTITYIDRGCNSSTICRIKSYSLILETVKLFIELWGVKLRFLQKPSEMVLPALDICLSYKSISFFLMLNEL